MKYAIECWVFYDYVDDLINYYYQRLSNDVMAVDTGAKLAIEIILGFGLTLRCQFLLKLTARYYA